MSLQAGRIPELHGVADGTEYSALMRVAFDCAAVPPQSTGPAGLFKEGLLAAAHLQRLTADTFVLTQCG